MVATSAGSPCGAVDVIKFAQIRYTGECSGIIAHTHFHSIFTTTQHGYGVMSVSAAVEGELEPLQPGQGKLEDHTEGAEMENEWGTSRCNECQ